MIFMNSESNDGYFVSQNRFHCDIWYFHLFRSRNANPFDLTVGRWLNLDPEYSWKCSRYIWSFCRLRQYSLCFLYQNLHFPYHWTLLSQFTVFYVEEISNRRRQAKIKSLLSRSVFVQAHGWFSLILRPNRNSISAMLLFHSPFSLHKLCLKFTWMGNHWLYRNTKFP